MSIAPTVDAESADAFQAKISVRVLKADRPEWYRRTRLLLTIWAVLSIFWFTGSGYEIYRRVSIQADMSRDVERDLDQGFVNASCVGSACETLAQDIARPVQRTESLTGILLTYIRFGSDEMAETVLGPPVILLIAGIGAIFTLRRRRESADPNRIDILQG